MPFPDDEGLRSVLSSFGIAPEDLLGHGGEAWVYALDRDRVLRVLHAGADPSEVEGRQRLVEELGELPAPFELPAVLDVGERDGRWFAIERRLPGTSVTEQLAVLEGADRDRLVEGHLQASAAIGALHLAPRGWFGELLTPSPVRGAAWQTYLRDRAAKSLVSSTPEFRSIDAQRLAGDLPEPTEGSFVHLDAFAGNMLAVGSTVTAVLDIGGPTAVVGDSRMNPLSTAVYLSSVEITPTASPRDLEVAMSWLRSMDLADWYESARRWLAAFWCHALDDVALHRWCRAVLLPSRPSS